MNLEDTLLAYSEWLDGEKVIKPNTDEDDRDHGTLVSQFVEYWEEHDAPCTKRAPLALDISSLAETIHQISTDKGFTPPSMDNLPQKLMLSVSELAEAMEEHRKERGLRWYQHQPACPAVDCPPNGKCACSPKPEGILPELADSIIRNLHMMHSLILEAGDDFDMTVGEVIREKVEFNSGRPHMHGGNSY